MPEDKPTMHYHPKPVSATVYGRRLVPGDIIQPDDMYASSNGKWVKGSCPGVVLKEGVETVWVRPSWFPG